MYSLSNALDEIWHYSGNGIRKRLAVIEVLTRDRNGKRTRERMVESLSQCEDVARRESVGESRRPIGIDVLRPDLFDSKLAGTAVRSLVRRSGIDKEYVIEPAGRIRQFRRELMQSENLDLLRSELPFQSFGDSPSNSVVGTQRISISDDQDAVHILGSTIHA